MAETYPASLPTGPKLSGFKQEHKANVIRTKMSVGRDKLRKRYTRSFSVLTCKMLLTTAQLATFEAFFQTTLVEGTLNFDWTHPIDESAIEVRFIGEYVTVPKSHEHFEVAFKLETL